ncbi:putative isomerase YraM [Colletotrichum tanaceti]|uniref:Putative isomerase YraM n=1 Tax=Colletotrichum tanaceti TaxID=1306861 RepID=A0A4V6Y9I8_9PEZI|nr:putative isomerase YraM [Colletotrichum tanaceti]TKW56606.1 putative isomerase YraM [Colletotrichum tanaceti]
MPFNTKVFNICILAPAGSFTKSHTLQYLPAVLMCLFVHRSHLPPTQDEWATPFLAAMGSSSSATSKVAAVAPSSRPGVDVEHTFVQVAVGGETVDLSGNCGNICSAVGPFAVQERRRRRGLGWWTGSGSEIKIAFVEIVGSMTGKPFPSGKRSKEIVVEEVRALGDLAVDVTLIDSANPFVFVDAQSLPAPLRGQPADSSLALEVAGAIRRRGAVRMGLAATIEAAGLARGSPYLPRPLDDDTATAKEATDIRVQAYSMGKPHPGLQLTGGITLASAVVTEGAVAHCIAGSEGPTLQTEGIPTPRRTPSPVEGALGLPTEEVLDDSLAGEHNPGRTVRTVRIRHGSGTMDVEVWGSRGRRGSCVGPMRRDEDGAAAF